MTIATASAEEEKVMQPVSKKQKTVSQELPSDVYRTIFTELVPDCQREHAASTIQKAYRRWISCESKKELDRLEREIYKESAWVDIKRYSHNIISLMLARIMDRYGKHVSNRIIKEYELDALGWSAI